MPQAEGLNLREWIRRVWGPLSRAEPEVMPGIQPVIQVADGSALVPPLLPPAAFAGGRFAVSALAFGAALFQCRSAGGAFLRVVSGLDIAGNPAFSFALFSAAPALTASAVSTNYNMGPEPVRSRLTLGEVAALVLTPTDPQRGGFDGMILMDEVFVPSGFFFYVESINVGVDPRWHFLWTEVSAIPGPV